MEAELLVMQIQAMENLKPPGARRESPLEQSLPRVCRGTAILLTSSFRISCLQNWEHDFLLS